MACVQALIIGIDCSHYNFKKPSKNQISMWLRSISVTSQYTILLSQEPIQSQIIGCKSHGFESPHLLTEIGQFIAPLNVHADVMNQLSNLF